MNLPMIVNINAPKILVIPVVLGLMVYFESPPVYRLRATAVEKC